MWAEMLRWPFLSVRLIKLKDTTLEVPSMDTGASRRELALGRVVGFAKRTLVKKYDI